MNKKYKIMLGIKLFFGILFFSTLVVFVTMSLWNWLIPTLFHGPVISFWQALGLLLLSKLLFGFNKGFHKRHRAHHHWRNKFQEKFATMSPEERELFKQRFSEKCRGKFWMNDEKNEQN